MIRRLCLAALASLTISCGGPSSSHSGDSRLVLFGPSLTETVFTAGAGSLVVGVDRYSKWPPAADSLPEVGGYLDPALEQVAALRPTSIHSVGNSPEIGALAATLGVPYHTYSFDSLDDALTSMERLDSLYGGGRGMAGSLRILLDSLSSALEPVSVALVVSHAPGSGSVTLAGTETFLGGLVQGMGCELSAPGGVSYPRVSLEGVLELDPDFLVYLAPEVSDPEGYARRVGEMWMGMGVDTARVHILTQPYLLIPGPRMGRTAERISECLRSSG